MRKINRVIHRKKQVIFLGFAKLHKKIGGHFGIPVWSCNNFFVHFKTSDCAVDRVYQIHAVDKPNLAQGWEKAYNEVGEYVCVDPELALGHGKIFDHSRFHTPHGDLMCGSTFSYMFADAIAEGVDLIELKGVRLAQKDEYYCQLPSTLHNIDVARANGVVVIAEYEQIWRNKFEKSIKNKEIEVYLDYGVHNKKTLVQFTDIGVYKTL